MHIYIYTYEHHPMIWLKREAKHLIVLFASWSSKQQSFNLRMVGFTLDPCVSTIATNGCCSVGWSVSNGKNGSGLLKNLKMHLLIRISGIRKIYLIYIFFVIIWKIKHLESFLIDRWWLRFLFISSVFFYSKHWIFLERQTTLFQISRKAKKPRTEILTRIYSAREMVGLAPSNSNQEYLLGRKKSPTIQDE